MTTATLPDSKTLLKQFEALRAEQKQQEARIATREQLDSRERDRTLVRETTAHTPETLFQTLAKLQTTFEETSDRLVRSLATEVKRLADIQRAREVEQSRLIGLNNVRLAAEVLDILRQEHQQALQALEVRYQKQFEQLDKEMSQQRRAWTEEQESHDANRAQQLEASRKKRQQEEEEYAYQLARQHGEEETASDKRRREWERQIADERQIKERDWAVREAELAGRHAELVDYQGRLEHMPGQLLEATQKARDDGFRDTLREEEHKAALLEKERAAKKRTWEFRVEALNRTIADQKAKLADLTEKLQAASTQAQQLAMTAVATGKEHGATAS
ncbi:MAG: hypothetical protein RKO24_04075 [Candidatus Competibacter sp.]|nr:hypothetical protein [Candidatus Competibacter sp.]